MGKYMGKAIVFMCKVYVPSAKHIMIMMIMIMEFFFFSKLIKYTVFEVATTFGFSAAGYAS